MPNMLLWCCRVTSSWVPTTPCLTTATLVWALRTLHERLLTAIAVYFMRAAVCNSRVLLCVCMLETCLVVLKNTGCGRVIVKC